MNERNMWIDIIAKLYKNLHMSDGAMHGMSESDKKRDKILNYFDRLEKIHQKVLESKRGEDLKLLKKFYHNLYVIKPEDIPDSYFEHEKKIMRERGYGNIEITSERKQTLINQIIEDQEESLDKWIEYFLFDEESKSYEMWEKYWVFQGLQQLGKYNKETGKFSKRDKHTVYPFPPVEREAIFNTLKLMEDYVKDRKGDNEIKSALGSGNFKTLYEYSIKMIMNKGEIQSNTTEGVWIKYEQGSDYHKLRDSLQGYYTGWCTAAGESFAENQLESGDFYVYYTLDENGEAKVPRIAIRMNGHNEIREIRGVAENQNMEPEMIPILDKKLEEFPDRDKYRKKEYDMQFLTTIDNKMQKGYDLTKEELSFLYEIDCQIEGFGYMKDPRIKEIRSKRNLVKDLNLIFSDIDRFDYDLNLRGLKSVEGLKLPEYIRGNLDLRSLTSAEGLELPKRIEGILDLSSLTSAEGLKLPEYIGDCLSLNGLTSGEGLDLSNTNIGGDLELINLTSAEGLKLPENIGGGLSLSNLKSAEGLKLPEYIGGSFWLNNLKSAKGLDLINVKIEGHIWLFTLNDVEGLKLSKDFDVKKLHAPKYIINEINMYPEKYYINENLSEYKGRHLK